MKGSEKELGGRRGFWWAGNAGNSRHIFFSSKVSQKFFKKIKLISQPWTITVSSGGCLSHDVPYNYLSYHLLLLPSPSPPLPPYGLCFPRMSQQDQVPHEMRLPRMPWRMPRKQMENGNSIVLPERREIGPISRPDTKTKRKLLK